MADHTVNLTEGDIGRHLVQLSVPMFLGSSAMIVASMIDTIYVGWIGAPELAAVSFAFPLMIAMVTIATGLGIGAASISARAMGAGDMRRVSRVSTDALLLCTVLVMGCCVVAYVFMEPLVALLGAEDDVFDLTVAYMEVWIWGLPLFSIPMVATGMMRAVGNARAPAALLAAGAGLQVIIAPALIFGIPGINEGIGLQGVAWSFGASRLLIFFITMVLMLRMGLLLADSPAFSERMESWREVLKIGVPSMVSNLVGPVSLAVTIALLARHGDAVVAGFGVASRIEMLATMLIGAVAGSTGPFAGQNWGAGLPERIYRAQSLAYRFSHAWAVLAALLLFLFGRAIVGLITDDPGVIEASYLFLIIVTATYGFMGVGQVASATFIALGKPMQPLVLSVGRMIVVYIPLALLLEQPMGYAGIFLATAVCNVLLGIAGFFWIRAFLGTQTARLKRPAAYDEKAPKSMETFAQEF